MVLSSGKKDFSYRIATSAVAGCARDQAEVLALPGVPRLAQVHGPRREQRACAREVRARGRGDAGTRMASDAYEDQNSTSIKSPLTQPKTPLTIQNEATSYAARSHTE